MNNRTLNVWNIAKKLPLGKVLFNQMIQLKAPYFKSIRTKIIELRPDFCQVQMSKEKRILNHLDTVHAIALCNLAELTGGLMTEVTLPPSHRWIPDGMQVNYIKKATTDLTAVAYPLTPIQAGQSIPNRFVACVEVHDQNQALVFRAEINMWVTSR
ncbi:hotdog fold domain-containing protein [Acinetobacter sp. YH12239]|uniref:hotdog fold domain-containing protein n=1 Tax=Acinetobacter sp. YH12239 TaxID=2601166 RepID=UPI0015D405D2|nr:hotdog fold domain-containing protein [Acinetobacter sp. YH12239]